MPATESTWRNQALMHRIFAVSGVLLTLTTVWMFYKDHARSWKVIQPKALEIEQKMTKWREEQVEATAVYQSHAEFEHQLLLAETEGISAKVIEHFIASLEQDAADRKTTFSSSKREALEQAVEQLNNLHAEAEGPRKEAETAAKVAEKAPADTDLKAEAEKAMAVSLKKDDLVRAKRKEIIAQLKSYANEAKIREDKLLNRRKVQNGKVDAARANVDIGIRDHKTDKQVEALQKTVDDLKAVYDGINKEYIDTSKHRKELDKIIKGIIAKEEAAKKSAADAQADLVRLETSFTEKQETWFSSRFPFLGKKVLTLPPLDAFMGPRKIDNLWSKDLEIGYGSYGNVRRFDRCTTCHQSMPKSLPGEPTSPAYVKAQDLEVVIIPPKAEDLPKRGPEAEPPTAEDLLGIRFAVDGLLHDSDITVKFVRPMSPAARGIVSQHVSEPVPEKPVDGALIREAAATFSSEPSVEESLFPKRPGLQVGDVVIEINGDAVLGNIRRPDRVAAMLADLSAEGKPITLTVTRGLPSPYTSHPRLDLYISDSSPHRMATFACTICHEGQGSATDFKWASHTPNDQVQAEAWTKDPNLGWFDNPHWIFPQYPRRFMESTCLKCHHEVVELEPSEKYPVPPAPKVVHGYQLIRKYGCFGCHEVNGFDGPAKRVGPDLRLEPNYFAVAQELTRGLPAREKKFDALLKQELAKKLGDQTVAEVQKEYQAAVGEQFKFEKEKTDLGTSTALDKDKLLATATQEAEKAKAKVDAISAKLEPVRKSLASVQAHLDQLARIRYLSRRLTDHPEEKDPRGELKGILDEDALNKEDPTLTPAEHRLSGMLKDVEVPGTLRKVGPALRYLGQKLDQEFLYDWLNDPTNFRATTRMPKFFNLHDHLQDKDDADSLAMAQRLEPIEIRGIMAFLTANQQKFEPLPQVEGIEAGTPEEQVTRGKFQFETRGCLACHTHDDFPDVTKYRRPEDIVQGPDLSNIHVKFDAKRNPQGESWLYSWIKEPTRYHARTVMPNLFLNKELHPKADPKDPDRFFDPAADVVAYLLSKPVLPEGAAKDVKKLEWKPVPEAAKKLTDISGAGQDLDELVKEYLKETFPAQVTEYLEHGIPADMEADLKGAEKELVVHGSADLLKLKLNYIGRKTIAKYGCYGCHDIPGFEDAKPIGTGLADWGRKDPSKLAFEHIAEYMEKHGHASHAAHDKQHEGEDVHSAKNAAAEAAAAPHDHAVAVFEAEEAERAEFFHHQLEASNRIGFINQKLTAPRSYDYKKVNPKNKKYSERLRMPQFPFTAEQRESVITFVLGLVAEPPRDKYLYKPSQRDAALIAGKKVLEKYNCGGCHVLETEKWKISYSPGDYGKQSTNPTYPFLQAHFGSGEIAAQAAPDYRNELHSFVSGMPARAAADGRPTILEDADDGTAVESGTEYDPKAVKYAFDLYKPALIDGGPFITGQNAIMIPNRRIDEKFPAVGGVLARYLIPRVTQFEKKTNPNASGSEAFGWVPPPLVKEGNKVQADWLHDFLLDPYPIRPAVFLRMPRFNMTPAEATDLVNYFAAHDNAKYPYELTPTRQDSELSRKELEYRAKYGAIISPEDVKESGRSVRFDHAMKIVTNNNYCVKCHQVADYFPPGSPRALAPNLGDVYRRLRPGYTRDWIANPKMTLPYTSMPVNIPYDGNAPYHGGISQDLFHGNAEEQVEGLVDLLTNFDQYAKTNTEIAKQVQPPPPAAAPPAAAPKAEEK